MRARFGLGGLGGLGAAAALGALAACSSGGESGERTGGAPVKPPPPLRIELGDCALPSATFVSGPRPRPFAFDRSDRKVAAAEPEAGASAAPPGVRDPSSKLGGGDVWGDLIDNDFVPGGFGFYRRGFGPGDTGGGTGWGSIGTGGGGMRGRRAPVPTLSIGQPNVQGDLDKAIIRRYVKRNARKLQYCYEKVLLVKPGIAGTVMTQLTITPDGNVIDAKASGVDPAVSACVEAALASIVFPKPKDGGAVQVGYPFVYRGPGASDPPDPSGTQQAGIGSGLPPGSGSASAPPTGPPPPATADRPPEPPHVPGAGNPLRGQEAALAACLRRQPRPYGVLVVELAYAASGTRAAVHGLDDEAARACVVEVARLLPKAAVPAHRCSVAFGELPLADAPAVEITAAGVRWLGKIIGSLDALAEDDARRLRIDALLEPAIAYGRETAAPAEPVALRGPVLLRAADATPMKLVHRVVHTLALAGVDLVPARHDGAAGWKLLRRVGSLPVVPVPLGTGGPWSHRYPGARAAAGEPRPELSILVTADRIWIGVSRANEIVAVSRTPAGHDLDGVERVLAEHKRGARFAGRDELEIAGDDAVPYGDVAAVLERADKAGFVFAQLVPPADLSARPQP